jgi:hypothetical protein
LINILSHIFDRFLPLALGKGGIPKVKAGRGRVLAWMREVFCCNRLVHKQLSCLSDQMHALPTLKPTFCLKAAPVAAPKKLRGVSVFYAVLRGISAFESSNS